MTVEEEVLKYYYTQEFVTPKEMANILCDNDPRVEWLKDTHGDYKSIIEKITYAFKCRRSTKLKTEQLFQWAVKKKLGLPVDLVMTHARAELELPAFQIEAHAINIPLDSEELEQAYIKDEKKIYRLEKEKKVLQIEVTRLLPYENKEKKRLEKSKIGGEHSRGKEKDPK